MTLLELVERGIVVENHSLAGMTTYKFGGPAAWYAEVSSFAELELVIDAAPKQGGVSPVFILGRGSNVVISDTGYPGVVVRLGGEFNEVTLDGGVATAGAGVALPRLARTCAAAGRGGLEFYVGIPGSVGGAIVMNAGGHGSDTAEWLMDASIFDSIRGEILTQDATQLDLSYRHSRLGAKDIVLSARFNTVERAQEDSESLMREITAWRRRHQPGGTFNAGSVFKNPSGDAAGRIIDAAGLKGLKVGGVEVSSRHANFFVATGDACAQDVHDLVRTIQRIVKERSGIELTPEIRFIGDFSRAK